MTAPDPPAAGIAEPAPAPAEPAPGPAEPAPVPAAHTPVMAGHAELSLVRHGESVWHAENRYAGRSDIALNATGRAQADQLGRWAAAHPHDVVVCSPLGRAVATAAPAARALGLTPRIVPELSEADFGAAEGRTLAELEAEDPAAAAAFRADPVAHPFAGAEPPGDTAERVAGALGRIAADHVGRRVLVVAHNTALRLALCHLLGVPLAHYRRVLPRLENVAVTLVRMSGRPDGQPPALLGLNLPTAVPGPGPAVRHPGPAAPGAGDPDPTPAGSTGPTPAGAGGPAPPGAPGGPPPDASR